jgi:fatty acid synthase
MVETGASTLPKTQKKDMASPEEVLRAMAKHFSIRIDPKDIVESPEPVIHLNQVDEGPPVFFIHSIEGLAGPLKKMGNSMPWPAYCIQSTSDTPQESISEMAEHYVDVMRKHQPEGPYRLIGCSYGASVAFEMVQILKDKGDQIETIVLVDGSHQYTKIYEMAYRAAFGQVRMIENPTFESEILCQYTAKYGQVDYGTNLKELAGMKTWQERVEKTVDNCMESGLFQNREAFISVLTPIKDRLLCADKYAPKHKFEGNIDLIRPVLNPIFKQDVEEDYGLSQAVTGQVEVHTVEADPETMLLGGETMEILSRLLTAKNQQKPITDDQN